MQNNTLIAKDKLNLLQKEYPALRFSNTIVETEKDRACVKFCYELNHFSFETVYELPLAINVEDPIVNQFLKYLGIVESFSYWKLTCSPEIILDKQHITDSEKSFFKKLLLNGMSEFLFRNELPLDISVEINAGSSAADEKQADSLSSNLDGALVLVGGGKDSIVSLETLRLLGQDKLRIVPFSVNPIKASIDCINQSQFDSPIYCRRIIDKKLYELNKQNFFNGHIPFSAVLSFVSSLVAYSKGLKYVVSSNESSANQGNVISNGVEVNHQYSKSFEFEKDLSELFADNGMPIQYFSLLRPLNEVQITKIFSNQTRYHSFFQSCNVQQTLKARAETHKKSELTASDRWCGICPKCVFVYLMLNLFLPKEKLVEIFGADLSSSDSFREVAKQLSDPDVVKPFECVGTFEEVDLALKIHDAEDRSSLKDALDEFLNHWNSENMIPAFFESALKKQLTIKV